MANPCPFRPTARAMLIFALILPLTSLAGQPAAPGNTMSPDQMPWLTLFALQPWYLQQPGQEQGFTGILEAVPAPGNSSTLQRPAYYRLGQRTVYTGVQRPAALEGLVGEPVLIRGKAIDFSLEGAVVHEIWPAAIRRISAP